MKWDIHLVIRLHCKFNLHKMHTYWNGPCHGASGKHFLPWEVVWEQFSSTTWSCLPRVLWDSPDTLWREFSAQRGPLPSPVQRDGILPSVTAGGRTGLETHPPPPERERNAPPCSQVLLMLFRWEQEKHVPWPLFLTRLETKKKYSKKETNVTSLFQLQLYMEESWKIMTFRNIYPYNKRTFGKPCSMNF